ncbi:MAG: outer membrane beta-barrel protein [Bacteroidota bacterium]
MKATKNRSQGCTHWQVKVATTLLLTTLFFSSTGFCQRFSWGLSYGISVSSWMGETDNYVSDFEQGMKDFGFHTTVFNRPRFGLGNAGLILNYKIKDWFAVQTEVDYLNEGTHLSGYNSIDRVTMNLRMAHNVNYLQIPIFAQFNSESGWFIQAGPYMAIKLYSQLKVAVWLPEEHAQTGKQDLPGISSFDYGFGGGFGYKKGIVGFEMRYQRGFNSVLEKDAGPYKMTNSVFLIKVDFIFDWKKGNVKI